MFNEQDNHDSGVVWLIIALVIVMLVIRRLLGISL